MDKSCKVEQTELLTTGVFELPREPSLVINGLPPVSPQDGLVLCHVAGESMPSKSIGFGKWLVGREVRKLFGEQFYWGKVTEFDKEMRWYRWSMKMVI